MNGHARSCTQGGCVGCRVDRIEHMLLSLGTLRSIRALTQEEHDGALDEVERIVAELRTEREA